MSALDRPFADYGASAAGSRAASRPAAPAGAIGESWWSRRFLDVLESFALGSRLTRGRTYARKGQVLSLEVDAGRVTRRGAGLPAAAVPGHDRARAVRRAESGPGSRRRWPEQALSSARLLAGEMPPEIEEIFAAAGAPLFPAGVDDLRSGAPAPTGAVPCKHLAATFYLLAEAFDADPFLILRWRGRDREDLLARLREAAR